ARGVECVTGRALKLDEVSTAVQLRAHPHESGHMPGRVYLGNDGDEAVLGVGYESAKVFGAVEGDIGLRVLGRRPHGEAPALVVSQMQVQHVKLVEREKVDDAFDLIQREAARTTTPCSSITTECRSSERWSPIGETPLAAGAMSWAFASSMIF